MNSSKQILVIILLHSGPLYYTWRKLTFWQGWGEFSLWIYGWSFNALLNILCSWPSIWHLGSSIAWCLQPLFYANSAIRRADLVFSRLQEQIRLSSWWVEFAYVICRFFSFSCCFRSLEIQNIVDNNFINFDTFFHFSFTRKDTLSLWSTSNPDTKKYVFLVSLKSAIVA